MRTRNFALRWAVLPVLFTLGGCELDWMDLDDDELLTATVTVVLTADPADSSWVGTDVLAVLTRHSPTDTQVPGASVRITGESGRSLQLVEVPNGGGCQSDTTGSLSDGTCYKASTPSAHFAPGEKLSLEIIAPNGKTLSGTSTLPDTFLPEQLSVRDGHCRLNPDTSYEIRWTRVEGGWTYIAEARFTGLPLSLWASRYPLHLRTSWMASRSRADMVFPRALVEGGVTRNARKAARRLETGLPWGVTADLAVAAVDRNWANWIRPGRYTSNGEARIPSVFGDGTGMFGTGTRWMVTTEARAADEETGLVDCGLAEVG